MPGAPRAPPPLQNIPALMTEPLKPGAVVGILGGGQLGRMLAVAAAKLGLRASIFAPEADSPAFQVAETRICAAYDDIEALRRFARSASAVTYEFENVPAHCLAVIEEFTPVAPPRRALVSAQDRLAERRLLQACGLPVSPHEFVPQAGALPDAFARLRERGHQEAYLKRLRHGYDGKGQVKIASAHDLADAAAWLANDAAILEAAVDFLFELSVIAVRGKDGAMAFYDTPRNVHLNGILSESVVPAGLAEAVSARACDMARAIMVELDYVGVLGVEMFAIGDRNSPGLVINEIAPRVHNSGHWTLDACAISQFENHIRAVAGWPLGDTARHSNARMVNLIGEQCESWQQLIREAPLRSLHLYGKAEAREGRKMGHYCDLLPLSGETASS